MTITDTTRATSTRGNRERAALPTWLRVVLGIAAAVIAGFAAFVALAIGAIVTTGCLMGCTTPDPVAGAPILALSAALFSLSLVGAWWAFVNKHWRTALTAIAAIGVICAIGLVLVIEAPY